MAETISLPTFFAQKAGMTRIFNSNGESVPVTVLKLIPNVITQVKTKEKDGYEAYQLGYSEKREALVNSAIKGHLKKNNITNNFTKFSEVKLDGVKSEDLGKKVAYENFTTNTYVDVSGLSKGKGTAGVMKRFNFQGGPAAHGSHFHRRPGSSGNRATPGRVFARKKMPGRLGQETSTIQNLQVVELNTENGYMLIKGSIPGGKNTVIQISKAVKKN